MNAGDVVPDILRSAMTLLLLLCVIRSIRVWRRPKNDSAPRPTFTLNPDAPEMK